VGGGHKGTELVEVLEGFGALGDGGRRTSGRAEEVSVATIMVGERTAERAAGTATASSVAVTVRLVMPGVESTGGRWRCPSILHNGYDDGSSRMGSSMSV